jgi:hypothetical protein
MADWCEFAAFDSYMGGIPCRSWRIVRSVKPQLRISARDGKLSRRARAADAANAVLGFATLLAEPIRLHLLNAQSFQLKFVTSRHTPDKSNFARCWSTPFDLHAPSQGQHLTLWETGLGPSCRRSVAPSATNRMAQLAEASRLWGVDLNLSRRSSRAVLRKEMLLPIAHACAALANVG